MAMARGAPSAELSDDARNDKSYVSTPPPKPMSQRDYEEHLRSIVRSADSLEKREREEKKEKKKSRQAKVWNEQSGRTCSSF